MNFHPIAQPIYPGLTPSDLGPTAPGAPAANAPPLRNAAVGGNATVGGNAAVGLYVHFPWCVHKCPYCDFNSHATTAPIAEGEYVQTLLADLAHEAARVQGRQVQTIFFGGGTPSLFSGLALRQLLYGIQRTMAVASDAEITLEANPGTIEAARFAAYRDAGINRLSIGVQSFQDSQLQALQRIHSARDASLAVRSARAAGFDNINIDLMFGLPSQTVATALADLRQAVDLAPTHVSWYQLTLEPNTALAKMPPDLPEDDAICDIQQAGMEFLAREGYAQYEVSAYAQPGWECRHNLNYWMFGDYLGIGAGAHGKVSQWAEQAIQSVVRTRKPKSPAAYYANPTGFCTELQPAHLSAEFMLNALRLTHGVPAWLFMLRTGLPWASIEPTVIQARAMGWLESIPDRLVPTPAGRQFLNDLLELFV